MSFLLIETHVGKVYEGGETRKMNKNKGFTLIELLVVIGILAILTAVVLVAVNPGRQLAQARNTARAADVNAILTAITAENADPDSTVTLPDIQACSVGAVDIYADGTAVDPDVDLSDLVPTYIAALPEDPSDTTPLGETGYTICTDDTGIRYTVCSATVELPATTAPCVTR